MAKVAKVAAFHTLEVGTCSKVAVRSKVMVVAGNTFEVKS
jgi:hypothetical protein